MRKDIKYAPKFPSTLQFFSAGYFWGVRRQCINELQKSRDAIQLIAIQLTSVNNKIDKEEEQIEQFKEKSIEKEKEDHTQKERLEKKTLFRT